MYDELKKLYGSLRNQMNHKWNRDMPLGELLFDRWERAQHLGFGEGANIYHNSYVYGDVTVGRDTWIGPYTLLDGTGGLEIGESCCISAGVHIYTHDTVKHFVSGGKDSTEYHPVKIGSFCYIGPQSVVRGGVIIGDHSIIGACSFVNTDIPPSSIAVGSPARIIGEVRLNSEGKVILVYHRKSEEDTPSDECAS